MDYCVDLKKHLEETFSMQFDVTSSFKDGEMRYACCPSNEDNMYFTLTIYIHNNIRLVIDIEPQLHGGYILNDMSLAEDSKRKTFHQYKSFLQDLGAKVSFKVNDKEICGTDEWPAKWKTFSCRITKLPISEQQPLTILQEWSSYGIELIFSLLTITEIDNDIAVQTEGTMYEIRSVRYERNPINRKLCLHKKGYTCSVCGMNFYDMYGEIGHQYIEVHHTTPVSVMGENYKLDIERDLVPLCSNCHSMAHRRKPPYTISELRAFVEEQTYGTGLVAEDRPEYGISERNDVIVGVVKNDRIQAFFNHEAKLYYFGKKFPSKYNLKDIKYFAPYFNGGIRGYYEVAAIRTARKSEIDKQGDEFENDVRIVLDLGAYHDLTNEPIKVPLANYNHAFIQLSKLKSLR